MIRSKFAVALTAAACAVFMPAALAEPKTVCTVTINSADEKEIFRRSLPPGDFQFVELVERGRSDWLASACQKRIQCDVLMISGHFDGGVEFYSDRPGVRESLPVEDMERAVCSDSCPGVFSHLKEVYLFGCNTLNPEPLHTASPEVARSLARAGRAPAEIEQIVRGLNERHGGSNRDRMRQIFSEVPAIYGFTSKAPLGHVAGPVLERYFQSGGRSDVASGRPSARLLSLFAPVSMTATAGLAPTEALVAQRGDMCRFVDERTSTAEKLAFVHVVLSRDAAEVRMFLDALDKYTAALTPADRALPANAAALAAIVGDDAARTRYLEFLRDADQASVRVRMIDVATRLGWLGEAERVAELMRTVGDRLAAAHVSPDEVDLVCRLNRDGQLGDEMQRLGLRMSGSEDAAHAAILACLGRRDAHPRVVAALTSGEAEAVQVAQVYLRHRPLDGPDDLRVVANRIAAMGDTSGQVRALETLATLRVSDRPSLEALTRLYPVARSVGVQRAIAGVLLRSDDGALSRPELARVLKQHRLKSPDGEDVIDVAIRRFQQS